MQNRNLPGSLRRRHLVLAAIGAAAVPAFAQADRIEGPIKIVLPFGPDSGTDVYARMVAQHLGVRGGGIVAPAEADFSEVMKLRFADVDGRIPPASGEQVGEHGGVTLGRQ